MFNNKRGQSGVGTLIIFIAMVLVAAIAAGVLIQTSSVLENKALDTGKEARSEVTTHLSVITISGTDGRYGASIDEFSEIIKLSSGSDPIRFDKMTLIFDGATFMTTMQLNKNATDAEDFFTYGTQITPQYNLFDDTRFIYLRNDINEDGIQEKIKLTNSCDMVTIDFRNGTQHNFSLGAGVDLSNCGSDITNCAIDVTYTNEASGVLGTFTIKGTSQTDCSIDENVVFTTATRERELHDQGLFTVSYIQQGNDWQDGYIQKGDIVDIRFKSAISITEDQKIRTNLIPKAGIPTPIIFQAPEVISKQRMFMYP